MEKTKAKNEILTLWGRIQELFINEFDIKTERLELKLDKNNIPQLYFKNKGSRTQTSDFEVRYTDEKGNLYILSTKEYSGSEIIRRFIKIVGEDNVRELEILTAHGDNIVGENDIFTKTANSEKKDTLRQIISKLSLNAQIIDLD